MLVSNFRAYLLDRKNCTRIIWKIVLFYFDQNLHLLRLYIEKKKKKCLNTFGYFHFYQPMMELVSNFRVFFMFGQNRLINFNFKKKSTQNAVSFTIIVVILTLNAYRKQKKKVRHYAQFTLFFSLLSTT